MAVWCGQNLGDDEVGRLERNCRLLEVVEKVGDESLEQHRIVQGDTQVAIGSGANVERAVAGSAEAAQWRDGEWFAAFIVVQRLGQGWIDSVENSHEGGVGEATLCLTQGAVLSGSELDDEGVKVGLGHRQLGKV